MHVLDAALVTALAAMPAPRALLQPPAGRRQRPPLVRLAAAALAAAPLALLIVLGR
jgi:hypothetical protein